MCEFRDVGVIDFVLNENRVHLEHVDPEKTLFDYLTSVLRGTKKADDVGRSGADTVCVVWFDKWKKCLRYEAVPSCVVRLIDVDGRGVLTVEGLGTKEKMNPIQSAFVDHNASQCGFCTSGFIMSLFSVLNTRRMNTKIVDIEECFDGNLCRCTGYRPIADAARIFAFDEGGSAPEPFVDFPEDRLEGKVNYGSAKVFKSDSNVWYQPRSLQELKECVYKHNASVVCSGSSFLTDRKPSPASVVSTRLVDELNYYECAKNAIHVGSAMSISRFREELKSCVEEKCCSAYSPLVPFLRYVGSTQLRNISSVVGSVLSANKDSDLLPILFACEATVVVENKMNQRVNIPIRTLIPEYGKTNLKSDDVVIEIALPHLPKNTIVRLYRQARRRVNALPFVSCACVARFGPSGLDELKFSCSGHGRGIFEPKEAVKYVLGNKLNVKVIETACEMVLEEITADSTDPHDYYKRVLIGSFFRKFLLVLAQEMETKEDDDGANMMLENDAISSFGLPTGEQTFEKSEYKYIGKPVLPRNMPSKVTGDLVYPLDVKPTGVCYAAFVKSTRPHAKIISVDPSKALEIPGVIGYTDVSDIPGKNAHSGIKNDTTVFADGLVSYVGQPIGTIVAHSYGSAKKAAGLVEIIYEDLPAVLSIEQAIAEKKYLEDLGIGEHQLNIGDPDSEMGNSDVIIESEFNVGGQDHYYMEVQNCVVIPEQEGRYVIHSSTQNPTKVQADVSWALNIPMHAISCSIDQIGGGYGGKQDRPCVLATAAAVTSKKFGVPVKLFLERDEDMEISGGRHPFWVKYKAGFKKDGRYHALDLLIVCDGGYTADVTQPVMDKTVFQSQNAYTIPHFRVEGRAAQTNRVTNTAFRGFGAPQSHIIQETIMTHAHQVLNIEPSDLREMNLNRLGDTLIAGTYLTNGKGEDMIRLLWARMMETSQYKERRKDVDEFNKRSRYIKRGISLLPLKNAVNFEEDFMNQAGALVHVYNDGSVAVSHGGSEMGQGLHTKMQQIAAETLDVPMERVRVIATDTAKVPNTQPTAASSGADLNGPAVAKACQAIKERLQPYIDANPDKTWEQVCNMAYFGRVNMSQSAHIHLPPLQWFWSKKKGYTGFYYDWGCVSCEVEVDTLTGSWRVLRADLLEDAGKALNPSLDVGQVEGGFTQGYGLVTMEDVVWDLNTGKQTESNVNEYAIPTMDDAPRHMNTELMGGVQNPGNVFASKSTAEAPVLMGTGVSLAIHDAILSARRDNGAVESPVVMGTPFTSEKIRLACCDSIVQKVLGGRDNAVHYKERQKI